MKIGAYVTILNNDPVYAASGSPISTPTLDTSGPMQLTASSTIAFQRQRHARQRTAGQRSGRKPDHETKMATR